MDTPVTENTGLEIAIIGIACRFPGARTLDEFWKLVRDGVEAIRPLTDQEILACGIDADLLRHPDYVKAASVLDDVEYFDAEFFGYSAKEAEIMDPQARILLECAWEALEHAGYSAEDQRQIGVYAGSSGNSYLQNNLRLRPELTSMISEYQLVLGNGRDFLPTRISYKLNLTGPAINIQTGCSTSLVAIHTACQSLLNGECDIALAGGICIMVPQTGGYLYQEGGIHSPDGHCRAFDAQSAGTISGSGAGIVVLKRLECALADGDTIHAIIKGSAINNDGAAKVSFTAPSVEGQARVIRDAHLVANIPASSISYVEAHGTGTQLGDPIEFEALTRAFRASSDENGFCPLGSVKTNIGHLDTAAGVAGLIKTVLSLQHQQIPPNLHFQQANPAIDCSNSPFYINTQLTPWPTRGEPRRAGVSSFGIGGTNAHVILEEAPPRDEPGENATNASDWHLLTFSAKTPTALQQIATNLATHLKRHPEQSLDDISYTLQVGRKAFAHKGIVVCQTREEAIQDLESTHLQQCIVHHQELKDRPVIFLFPGQGAQYSDMGRGLYQDEPIFRTYVDRCAELLQPVLGVDLRTVLYPTEQTRKEMSQRINQTAFTQPALFTIEYALAQLWMSWGIMPQAMIGHSIGEYVAACLAGVFSLEDALLLTAIRGKLMQSLPGGSMLAVSLSEEQLMPLLGEQLSLAAINGPARCVVSGPTEAIEAFANVLSQQEIACSRLHTSHAFHSAMMEPIAEQFAEQFSAIACHKPEIPYLSNLTGNWITADEATDPHYWVQHMRQAVRCSDGIATLLAQYPDGNFLEVGPGQTLTALVKQHLTGSGQAVFSSLSHPRDRRPDRQTLLTALGQLWLHGVTVQWSSLYNEDQHHRIPLPTYPFERKRYWIDARPNSGAKHGTPLQTRPVSALPCTDTLKECTMTAVQPRETVQSARFTQIMSTLQTIFSELLNLDAGQMQPETSFFEIGADSLFLLQANQAIRNTFQVAIPFRAMLDGLSTFGRLAQRIDQELPADSPLLAPLPQTSAEQTLASSVQNAATVVDQSDHHEREYRSIEELNVPEIEGGSDLARLMTQQLQIIAKQLDVLGKRSGSPATPKSQPARKPSAHEEKIPTSPPSHTKNGLHGHKPPQQRTAVQNEDIMSRALQKRPSTSFNARQQEHVTALIQRLSRRTKSSKQHTQQYRPYLADNRASAGFRQPLKEVVYPLIEQRGQGAHLWDIDGNEYVDLAMGFGALLYGHSPEFIIRALEAEIPQGIRLGPQSQLAGKVAQLICEVTGNERAAFCNSGTEAVMTAIRLARAVTGRNKIVVFSGAYHGTFDGVLVRPQELEDGALRTLPLAPGVIPHMVEDVMILRLQQPETLDIIRHHAHDLAAVIVEPPQTHQPDFDPTHILRTIRTITQEAGCALIIDEVVTGFRTHPAGIQALMGIKADITTYGKALGGGLPVGAIAGKAQFLDAIDGGQWQYGDDSYPEATQTFYAGTYFKHPFVMAAVWAVLNHLKERGPELQEHLSQRTAQLAERLNRFFTSRGAPVRIAHFRSLFHFVFQHNPGRIEGELFFYHLLEKGIYTREGRTCFLSTAHTDDDLDTIVNAVKQVVIEMQEGGFLQPMSTPPDPSDGRKKKQDILNFPLTDAQKELWVTAHMGEDASRAYNEGLPLRLRGQLDVQALHTALQMVVDRHEALRTTFSDQGDVQCVAQQLHMQCPLLDFSHLAPAEREQQLETWIAREVAQPFDLASGPLLRAHVLKLEQEDHLLMLTYHHIILDGWSTGILLQEFAACYSAACQGQSCTLPEALPYHTYAQWQHDQQHALLKEAEAYWRTQLADPPLNLQLPTDHPREQARLYAGKRYQARINAQLTHSLKNLSTRQRCTLFTTLLSGLQLLLHQLSGERDLIVGIPTAGQAALGNRPLVGHCVNVLPLRSRIGAHETIAAYLNTVKQTLFDAYDYQICSFIRLVKMLQVPRDPARFPLISVMFNLEGGVRGEAQAFAGLDAAIMNNPTCPARFDLFFNVIESGDDLQVECDYNADLFDLHTIEHWMQRWQSLLVTMATDAQQQLWQASLLTSDELALLLRWNPAPQPSHNLPCLPTQLRAQAERTPDTIALNYQGEQLSYQALFHHAETLAHRLQVHNIDPDSLVGLCCERGSQHLIALLAIMLAGAAFLPLDTQLPEQRLRFLLTDAQPELLLADTSNTTRLRELTTLPLLALQEPTAEPASTSPLRADVQEPHPQQLAYVIYTSGSTGIPKGVQITHRGLAHLVAAQCPLFSIHRESRVLQFATHSFDASVSEIFTTLAAGACLVLAPRDQLLPGPDLQLVLAEQAVSVVTLPPTALQLVDAQTLPALQTVVSAGEACPRELVEGWRGQGRFLNAYGPTEVTVCATAGVVPTGQPLSAVPSIGRPLAHCPVYVLDEQMQPVPIGVVGELYVGGEALARGYRGQAGWTAERFVPDPFSGQPGARLYRTGDRARWRATGDLEYVGRRDRQVKLRGYRIELEEIEEVLRSHEQVEDCAVVVRQEEQGERWLVGYVVRKAGPGAGAEEWRAWLKERLPSYQVPARIVELEALPLLPSGKHNLHALPAPTLESARHQDMAKLVMPRTPLEQLLADIWSQILNVRQISIHDNFFELGGDSILSIQITSRLNQHGYQLTPRQVFRHQTIAELALVVDQSAEQEQSQEVIAGTVPLTPIQHWLLEQDLAEPWYFNQAMMLEVPPSLDPELLEQTLQHLMQHHDALRMRLIRTSTGWVQQNLPPGTPFALQRIALADRTELERKRCLDDVARQLQASLQLTDGPIMQAAFFDYGSGESGRLFIVIHHLVIDIVSWRILLEDLQKGYQQLRAGKPVQLPPRTTSFKAWAEHLTTYAQSEALQQEQEYWCNAARRAIVPLPVDYPAGINSEESACKVSVILREHETRMLLQKVQRIYRCQISDALLAALAYACSNWTGSSSVLFDLEHHGREESIASVDLSRTVGWFTALAPVRLDLEGTVTPGAIVKRVRDQLRHIPNGGIGYGLLRYLSQDQTYVRQLRALPQSQISFNYLGRSAETVSGDALFRMARESSGPSHSPRNERPYQLEVIGFLTEGQLHIDWVYSEHLHQKTTIEHIAQTYIAFLQALTASDTSVIPQRKEPVLSSFQQQKLHKALSTVEFGGKKA